MTKLKNSPFPKECQMKDLKKKKERDINNVPKTKKRNKESLNLSRGQNSSLRDISREKRKKVNDISKMKKRDKKVSPNLPLKAPIIKKAKAQVLRHLKEKKKKGIVSELPEIKSKKNE